MVKKPMYWKNLWKTIGKTKARFFSIFAIVFLGAMVFAGLRNTPGAMMKTMDTYLDKCNYAELTYISTLGFSEEDLRSIKKLEGIEEIRYGFQFDALTKLDNKQAGITVFTAENYQKGMLNQPLLMEGRYPKTDKECIMDYYMLDSYDVKIGDTIKIHNDNGEKEFEIVGFVKDVRYVSKTTRGTNTLGDGSNAGYIQILTDENEFLAIPEDLYELREEDVLYTQVYVGVKGAENLIVFTDAFDTYIEDINTRIKSELSLRMSTLYEQYTKDAKEEYEKGLKEYEEGKSTFDKKILEAKILLTKAKIELAQGEVQYLEGQEMATEEIASMISTLTDTSQELIKNLNALEEKLNENEQTGLRDVNTQLQKTRQKVSVLENEMEKHNADISKVQEMDDLLNASQSDLLNSEYTLAIQKYEQILEIAKDVVFISFPQETNDVVNNVQVLIEKVNVLKSSNLNENEEINNIQVLLKDLKGMLNGASSSMDGLSQLTDAGKQIENAKLLIQQQENELTLEELKVGEELEKAKIELDKAKELIDAIPKGKIYTLTRHENEGLVAYDMNVESILTIAEVFPLLFFLVSALVSLTTMTRMVEEQRGQNGTLRALGYSKWDVMQQYIVYVVAATLLACLLGMVVGTEFLPRIVCFLYNFLMFSMVGATQITYSLSVALATIFISVFVTLFATMSVLLGELNLMPAVLMRPKAPKIGKRILLEKVTFIWKRLSFNQKVTMRNIFRYKKRFFMSVVGIAGCTGLIITGFGINYSVTQVVTKQYDNVLQYDAISSLDEKLDLLSAREMQENILQRDEVTNIEGVYNKSTVFMKNKETIYGNTIVYQSMDNIQNFIDFNDYKSKDNIVLDDNGVILTQKSAEMMDVNSGDSIDIELDGEKYNVKVSAVMENYVGNTIYMSEMFYEELTQESLYINQIFMNLRSLSKSNKTSIETYMMDHDYGQMSYTETMGEEFAEQMSSLKIVVLILIICAGALNFIVLYNLTNINIQERKSEIATIKVLGFKKEEVYDYIFRENEILSIIGSLLGMFFGYLIHKFIMDTINLDIAMFVKELQPFSYVIAVVITIVFTKLINLSMRKVLNEVDMVESLKSIE